MAALEATLVLFLDPQRALSEVPTLRMLRRDLGRYRGTGRADCCGDPGRRARAKITVVQGFSQMGSGSLPGQDLPTHLVAVPSR